MELDSRPLILLNNLIKQKKVSVNKIIQDTNLSTRQIDYDLKKVNIWLEDKGYESIKKGKNGMLYVSQNLQSLLNNDLIKEKKFNLSSEERKYIIVLYLFINNEIVSLFHISSFLEVSKNTVLQDINQVHDYLRKYNVSIHYSRKLGYYLRGSEIDKRFIAYKLISLLFSTENKLEILTSLLNKEDSTLFNKCKVEIENLQIFFKYNFIEQEKNEFIFFIAFLILYFRKNKDIISSDKKVDYYIKDKEHEAALYLANNLSLRHQKEEIYFIAKLLLGLSIGDYTKDDFVRRDELLTAINHVIINFEEITGSTVKNKNTVMQNLYQHLIPTYYRLLFNIPITNPLLQTIKKEYENVFIIVGKIMYPVEDILNYLLPDEEIGYMTLHLGSSLEESYSCNTFKKKAIIVCPNGIGTSNIIKNELINLFPDVNFKGVFSPELIENEEVPAHDFIFSSILLEVNKPLFIIKPIMSDIEKAYLVKEVYSRLYNIYPLAPQLDMMMSIINKYAYVYDQDNLKKEIHNTIKWKSNGGEWRPMLSELINENMVQLNTSASDWEHAVAIGGRLLVDENIVSEEYVDAMINSIRDSGPYIVIAKNVALPHARPEEGAIDLGISMLTLSTPVYFGNSENDPVKYLFCLSAKNDDTHIRAMAELVQLLEEKSFYEVLEGTSSSNVIAYIKKFEKENLT
ncbi:BglG family transcription antiterminator [Mammaliicoccus lentus]|uniref:BglG family transcription antiterminator n=1 Tax=Mammaliicoccus lentus TaxID=42858 RepID=UPI003CF73AA8